MTGGAAGCLPGEKETCLAESRESGEVILRDGALLELVEPDRSAIESSMRSLGRAPVPLLSVTLAGAVLEAERLPSGDYMLVYRGRSGEI